MKRTPDTGTTAGRRKAALQAGTTALPWPIVMAPVSSLRPASRRTRTHPKVQIDQLSDAMKRFGMMVPVVVDRGHKIVAGHARVQAAERAGLQSIPVIRAEHLSDTELRAFALADNKLAEKAGWDREALVLELEELEVALPEIGLDLSATGFAPAEIDAVFDDLGKEQPDPEDDISAAIGPSVARVGDLFLLGPHRLVVGDARDEKTFDRLMQGSLADMGFHDPPYNVRVDGHVGGRGRIKHREFAFASGEMSSAEFVRFLIATLGACARVSKDGSIHYVCMDWRHTVEVLTAAASVFDEHKNTCVWAKTNAGQGSFYRSQHEFIHVFKRGKGPHLNTFGLGAGGRSRTNLWRYPGVNTFKAGRDGELAMHPTVKPIAMIRDAMKDCSRRGAIVLDAFAGSGTTIMAAEQIGRRAYCIEIDPLYADVAVRRWQQYTRSDAIEEATGRTFDDLAAERLDATAQRARLSAGRRSREGR